MTKSLQQRRRFRRFVWIDPGEAPWAVYRESEKLSVKDLGLAGCSFQSQASSSQLKPGESIDVRLRFNGLHLPLTAKVIYKVKPEMDSQNFLIGLEFERSNRADVETMIQRLEEYIISGKVSFL